VLVRPGRERLVGSKLGHTLARLRCGDCGHDKLLGFSCKRRGFCPSCGARRMSPTAARRL